MARTGSAQLLMAVCLSVSACSPRRGCRRRRSPLARRRSPHPQPLQRRVGPGDGPAHADHRRRRHLPDPHERAHGAPLRAELDGGDRPRWAEPQQGEPGERVPRAGPVAGRGARGGPVLRHGVRHAGGRALEPHHPPSPTTRRTAST